MPDPRIPDHVPPELVWDNSYEQFLHRGDDPFEAAGGLHDGPDLIWATNATYGMPAWIPTRHELVKEAFSDYEHFSNARGSLVGAVMESDWMLLPVESDPPDHRYYRNVLNPFFTPVAINQREASVQAACDSLISKLAEFASILPNSIVISLLGMPQEMLQQFLQWEETAVHGENNEERFAAAHAIIDYLKSFIAEQKANPRSELLRGIIAGQFRDRSLNDAEILGICYLLFVAGLDTVFNTMGWIMRYLARDHELQNRLRTNPHEIPAAVEEFTRAYGVSAPSRTVAKDCEFHGVTLRKGDDMIVPTVLAGRDPRAFPDPHKIDIDRKPRHVTFGFGPHVCLGVHLAKREMKIVIESFLQRMENIRIPDNADIQYHTASTIGLDNLPLVWD